MHLFFLQWTKFDKKTLSVLYIYTIIKIMKCKLYFGSHFEMFKIHLICWIMVILSQDKYFSPVLSHLIYGPHVGKPTTAHLQITFN